MNSQNHPRQNRAPYTRPAVALTLAVLGGCAHAKIVKIPHPSSYGYTPNTPEWRKVLEKSDRIEGTRFYLPRPFVIVKREFPVATDTFFLEAQLESNGSLEISSPIPEALEGAFPGGTLAVANVHDPHGRAESSSFRRQSERTGDHTNAPDPTPKRAGTPIKKKSYVLATTAAPKQVDAAGRTVQLTVSLDKAPIDKGEGGTLLDEIWVLPMVGEKLDADKAQAATAIKRTVKTDGKIDLRGEIAAKGLPAFYALGAVVETTKNGKDERLLFHRSEIAGTNPFASTSKPDTPSDTPAPSKPDKPLTSATLTTKGDPATSTYRDVGTLFDIALYPDFTEQYAMRAQGNLGYAKADLALENGWLAERVSMEMDNRELGKLVADTARKLVDTGIAAISPTAAAAEMVASAPVLQESEFRPQAEGRNVLLRVDSLKYATPGMHPLLKPEEYGAHDRAPRVDYTTRTTYVISLVSLRAKNPGTVAAGTGLTRDDITRLENALDDIRWTEIEGHDGAFEIDPGLKIGQSNPAAQAMGTLSILYDDSAKKSGATAQQIEDYFKVLAEALRTKTGIDALELIDATPNSN